jgi:hypothetical protein
MTQNSSQQKYAKLYAEIEIWLNVACGRPMPEDSSLKRTDIPIDAWESFMRGAACSWSERQHVAIRQVLVWPPAEEEYSEWDLNGLCEQAELVLGHLHADAFEGSPEIPEPNTASLTTGELVSLLNQTGRRVPSVRDALATDAFVQEKLAQGRTMYVRNPDGSFSEVTGPTDDEPPEPVGTPVH